MKTFMAHLETVERKWYIIDASGRALGRTATVAAAILRGKNKPEFTPHVDCGDHVIILNAARAELTGGKLDKKFYRHHSGYIGGLKEVPYRKIMANRPEMAMTLAVKGMLPHNSIGAKSINRLRVFRGEEHNHQAQKPEPWTMI